MNRSFSYSSRDVILQHIYSDIQELTHNGAVGSVSFKLFTPNRLCRYRLDTFSTKEPELLDWLDEYRDAGAFFDIGANIGIYSLYAAQAHKMPVYSFEPSVFNLRQLCKNVSINNLSDLITVVPIPLSDNDGISKFIVSSEEEGGALNAFGVEYGFDGQRVDIGVEYNLPGMTLDSLLETGLIRDVPALIKIDVDGIEHLIIDGARGTLTHPDCISVLVEVNENFVHQAENVTRNLKDFGFALKEQRHSEILDSSEVFNKTWNQIWVKEQ